MAETSQTGGEKQFSYSKEDDERIRSEDTDSTRDFKREYDKWQDSKNNNRLNIKIFLIILIIIIFALLFYYIGGFFQ